MTRNNRNKRRCRDAHNSLIEMLYWDSSILNSSTVFRRTTSKAPGAKVNWISGHAFATTAFIACLIFLLMWHPTTTNAQTTIGFSQMKPSFTRGPNITDFVTADQFLIGGTFVVTEIEVLVHNDTPNVGNSLLNFSGTVSWGIHRDSGSDHPSVSLAAGTVEQVLPLSTGQSFTIVGGSLAGSYSVFRLRYAIPPTILPPGRYWFVTREGTWATASDGSIIRAVANNSSLMILNGARASADITSATPEFSIWSSGNLRFTLTGTYSSPPTDVGWVWVEQTPANSFRAVCIPTTNSPLIWLGGSNLTALQQIGLTFTGIGEVSTVTAPAASPAYFFKVATSN